MARHFFASGKGLLSNEEESLEVSAGDTGSEEALATLQAEGEAAGAEADAAVVEATVGDGIDGVAALENMRITLQAANENGGMDRFGAMMAKQHADFILQKFLKSPVGITMPSNESFGGAGSRIGAGVLTMEGIADKAREIWAAILKFMKKMKDKVMEWVHKLFGAAEKLEKRADAIKKRADTLTGTAKEKTFENDGIWNSLAIKGDLDGAKLKGGMNSIAKIAEEMVVNSGIINKGIKDALEAMNDINGDNADTKIAEAGTNVRNAVSTLKNSVTATVDLPGNVNLRPLAATGTGASTRYEGYGLPSNDIKAKTGSKCPTLDKSTIGDLCTIVKSIASSLVATRTLEKTSEETYKKLNDFGAKQAKESDVTDHKGVKEVKNASGTVIQAAKTGDTIRTGHAAVLSLFKQLSGAVDGPIKSLAGHCMKTAGKTLDYCDASIGQY